MIIEILASFLIGMQSGVVIVTTRDDRFGWGIAALAVALLGIAIFLVAMVLGMNAFSGSESDVTEPTPVIRSNAAPRTVGPNVATPIPTIAASLAVTPTTAGPNTQVTVTGSGFVPNSLINML